MYFQETKGQEPRFKENSFLTKELIQEIEEKEKRAIGTMLKLLRPESNVVSLVTDSGTITIESLPRTPEKGPRLNFKFISSNSRSETSAEFDLVKKQCVKGRSFTIGRLSADNYDFEEMQTALKDVIRLLDEVEKGPAGGAK